MRQESHRLTITLRDRNPQEAELWKAIEPMLKEKQFNQCVVNLLIEELVLSEEERRRRRYYRRLIEQMIFQGVVGAETRTIQEIITAGLVAPEGNFAEIEKE